MEEGETLAGGGRVKSLLGGDWNLDLDGEDTERQVMLSETLRGWEGVPATFRRPVSGEQVLFDGFLARGPWGSSSLRMGRGYASGPTTSPQSRRGARSRSGRAGHAGERARAYRRPARRRSRPLGHV